MDSLIFRLSANLTAVLISVICPFGRHLRTRTPLIISSSEETHPYYEARVHPTPFRTCRFYSHSDHILNRPVRSYPYARRIGAVLDDGLEPFTFHRNRWMLYRMSFPTYVSLRLTGTDYSAGITLGSFDFDTPHGG